jgi:hypothetical protein
MRTEWHASRSYRPPLTGTTIIPCSGESLMIVSTVQPPDDYLTRFNRQRDDSSEAPA